MVLWLQICGVVMTIALVFLVIYLISVLKSLKLFLDKMQQTTGELKNEVSEIGMEVRHLLHSTNLITLDVNTKLTALDPLFDTLDEIGRMTSDLTATVKHTASSLITSLKNERRKAINTDRKDENGKVYAILSGITTVMKIWKKLKKV